MFITLILIIVIIGLIRVENFKNDLHIFEYVKRGYYRLLGENYEYTGDIMHKPSKEEEYVAGHWKDGVLVEWNPRIN